MINEVWVRVCFYGLFLGLLLLTVSHQNVYMISKRIIRWTRFEIKTFLLYLVNFLCKHMIILFACVGLCVHIFLNLCTTFYCCHFQTNLSLRTFKVKTRFEYAKAKIQNYSHKTNEWQIWFKAEGEKTH